MSGRFRPVIASYVRGHDRVWEVERMRAGASAAGEPAVEWGRVPTPARFGVGVARTLDFQRGPAMRATDGPTQGASSDG